MYIWNLINFSQLYMLYIFTMLLVFWSLNALFMVEILYVLTSIFMYPQAWLMVGVCCLYAHVWVASDWLVALLPLICLWWTHHYMGDDMLKMHFPHYINALVMSICVEVRMLKCYLHSSLTWYILSCLWIFLLDWLMYVLLQSVQGIS